MFITADTIVPDYSDPQSLNRYAYARGNPLSYVDPSGHFSFKTFLKSFVSAFVGGMAFYLSGGTAAPLLSSQFIGASMAAGAAAGGTSAALNGQNIIKGTAIGAGIGAIGGGLYSGPMAGAVMVGAGAGWAAGTGGLDGLAYFGAGIAGGMAGSYSGNYLEQHNWRYGFKSNQEVINELGGSQEACDFAADRYGYARGKYDPDNPHFFQKSDSAAFTNPVTGEIFYGRKAFEPESFLQAAGFEEAIHQHQVNTGQLQIVNDIITNRSAIELDAHGAVIRNSRHLELTLML